MFAMSFDPLFAENNTIILHALVAIAAIILGGVQLARPKGTVTHRVLGWAWVVLMFTLITSSFNIHTIKQFGNFSLIHGISIFSLVMLPYGIYSVRRRNISTHKKTMIGLYTGALIVAGLFTLLPGRVMHNVVFGGP